MKRMAMMLCVIVAALLLVQVPAKAQFGIYGGVALPMGDFGDEKKGAAIMGFGGGLEYNMSLPALPIGWVTSISGAYNDLETKSLSEWYGSTLDYTPWITVWPMTGVRVSVPVFPVYGQVQIGVVFALAPEFEVPQGNYKVTTKADPAGAIGFSIGAGAGFGPLKIFARYMSGEPEFEFETKGMPTVPSEKYKAKQQISVVLLTVGLEF